MMGSFTLQTDSRERNITFTHRVSFVESVWKEVLISEYDLTEFCGLLMVGRSELW